MKLRTILLSLLLLPLAACGTAEGLILIHNEIEFPVTTVTIDACGATAPGPNRLDGGEIAPGGMESFAVGLGCWEVVASEPRGRRANWTIELTPRQNVATVWVRS
jgi:hypothetical protein